jgi:thiol:disulfide interchange protein
MSLRPFAAAAARRLLALASLLLLAAGLASSALAATEADLLPVDQAYRLEARAVSRNRVEFTWTIADGYYLYRHRFGVQPVDSSFKFNPLELPAGEKHTDEFFGEVETYRKSVTAVLTGATASGVEAVTFNVKFQGCADIGVCYPPTRRTVTVPMDGTVVTPSDAGDARPAAPVEPSGGTDPVATNDPLAALGGNRGGNLFDPDEPLPQEQAFKVEAIANAPGELLLRFTPAPGYYLYRDKTAVRVVGADGYALGAPRWPPGRDYKDEHFGNVVVYFDQVEVPVALARPDTAARELSIEVDLQGCQDKGLCYPPMTRAITVSLPAGEGAPASAIVAAPEAGGEETIGLFAALLLALGGGLVLNLMPCVLPVLSNKALGLVHSGESRARARSHASWYALGVLTTFSALGLLMIAVGSGWGYWMQKPPVVGALALLMFALGLSLSGLWQFGVGLAGTGQSLAAKSGPAGDFFTGVLAVVVASPCTAPFMGAAMAFAISAPAVQALSIFLMLGVGLALPFLLIGWVPALAARLPKPGAWMDTLKHWLALPMYLTAVWLYWVFGKQRGMDALALLLAASSVLAMGLWWWEKHRYADGRGARGLGTLLVLAALAAAVLAARMPREDVAASAHAAREGVIAFSPDAVAKLRAEGRPVLVNMTADWCITCKVNEKAVLGTDAFKALLARTNTAYVVGDWTNEDPAITAFLEQYKSPGVPLYVVFPADGGPGKKLPQVLSTGLLEAELGAAARKP